MEKENELKLIRLSDVETQEIDWLWYPYIPFGKITTIQGDPGGGKTSLALQIAAACSKGVPLPDGVAKEPFPVIYQSAEDGLADTIKQRLEHSCADQEKIFSIDESTCPLSMLDKRIEGSILQTGARLLILDPIQGYLGQNVDINRANEVRTVLKHIAEIAAATGCAVVLVGHLNKSHGSNSSYRGLGSIDFYAASRSVLLVGKMRDEPNTRVIVHDKSSLAPAGKSRAFVFGDKNVFSWCSGYETVTADQLLRGCTSGSKTDEAEDLIREMLRGGKAVAADKIFEAAQEKWISRRTVNEAKKRIGGISTKKVGQNWVWQLSR